MARARSLPASTRLTRRNWRRLRKSIPRVRAPWRLIGDAPRPSDCSLAGPRAFMRASGAMASASWWRWRRRWNWAHQPHRLFYQKRATLWRLIYVRIGEVYPVPIEREVAEYAQTCYPVAGQVVLKK